jgi:hypothetical protein
MEDALFRARRLWDRVAGLVWFREAAPAEFLKNSRVFDFAPVGELGCDAKTIGLNPAQVL